LTLRDQLRAGFWQRFVGGEGSRAPIIRRTDLVNNPGDAINVQITDPLTGSGVVGDETALDGSEENLATTQLKCVPIFRRHGVRWYRRAIKKSIIDLRGEGRMRLAEWGQEKMDDVRFTNFSSTGSINGETYTPNFIVVGGGTTGASDVGTTDLLDVESIQKAKLTLYNNRAMPLRTEDGNDFFGMVCHPNTLYYLKRSDEYRDWVREAEVRGKDNPFFKGAIAMVDGVVLFQHNNVVTAADGAGSIAVSRNLIFGAEAFIEGVSEDPFWAEDTFDYGNQFGIAYGFAFQPRRALAKNSLIVYASAVTP
jgi:N4-gp56 family major capsid protein